MSGTARKPAGGGLAKPVADPQLEIADARLRRLHEYWQKERGKRALPARTDIDPVALRFILGHLVLFDVLAEQPRFRIRLQGTELERWMGGNFTGKTIDALPSLQLKAAVEDALNRAVEARTPYHRIGEEIIDDIPRRFEALILPLASDGIAINMLLAAVVCRDDHSDA